MPPPKVNRPNSRFRELMAAQLNATSPGEAIDPAADSGESETEAVEVAEERAEEIVKDHEDAIVDAEVANKEVKPETLATRV